MKNPIKISSCKLLGCPLYKAKGNPTFYISLLWYFSLQLWSQRSASEDQRSGGECLSHITMPLLFGQTSHFFRKAKRSSYFG